MKLALSSCSCYIWACVLLCCVGSMPAAHGVGVECDSMDIRNDCNELEKLTNCTAIRGSLLVVLMPDFSEQLNRSCNYTQYSFPLLREITDYLVFFSVKGLSSVGRLFPNLTVIRGRRLFLDYALGVSDMPDLERLDFESLVSIKKGHAYIGSNPKLCNLDKIDWARLTKTQGDDHIATDCNRTTPCKGCSTDHCWAEGVCQVWENKEARHCHKECLGGCSNSTAQGCKVCQGLTDHGTCVEACPHDKYLWEDRQRCYSKEECSQTLGRFVHQSLCIAQCPTGFKANESGECMPCNATNCTKICQPNSIDVFRIVSLRDAHAIKGCEEINGSVYIAFENYVSEAELKLQFQSLRRIKGFLKIFRNSNLTTLSFLENLEEISAQPAEYDMYGLSIYGNKNLESLWTPKGNLTIVNASIYIHLNDKVCNQQLRQFQKQVRHDEKRDSVQLNDRDVLCGDPTLDVVITYIRHDTFGIVWPINQTSHKVEFIHRILGVNESFIPLNVDNGDICSKTLWSRRIFFTAELHPLNSTHFSYIFSDLQPDTRYGFSVKTFGDDYAHDSHSGFRFVHTQQDYPLPPFVNVIARSNDSVEIGLELAPGQNKDRIVNFTLDVYERRTNLSQLYNRNYCEQPFALEPTDQSEDFDSCCSNEGAKAKVRKLKDNLNRELSCSCSHGHECADESKLIQDKLFHSYPTNDTLFVLGGLKSSHVYILHTKACNSFGCSRYDMTVVRTLPTKHNGVGDLRACRVNDTTEYRVSFREPKTPNDIILSYRIYYRDYIAANDSYRIRISCITPLQYATHNHGYTAHFNSKFSEVSVSAVFLDEQVRSQWVNVTSCAVAGGQVHSAHSNTMNLFLICFMLGASGTLLWLCYKQKYWRKLGLLKNFVCHRFALLTQRNHGDREVLVENFVTFQNI